MSGSTYQALQRQVFIIVPFELSISKWTQMWCGEGFVFVRGFEELGVLDSKHHLRPQTALWYQK